LNAGSVSVPATQMIAESCSDEHDYYDVRNCPDCGADISDQHGNSKRCPPCAHVWRFGKSHKRPSVIRKRLVSVSPREIVLYLRVRAPKSLAEIEARIRKRKSG
jgi:predicted RNA-binding Zn-ribbon protein involved in translation (DUF1610 family)